MRLDVGEGFLELGLVLSSLYFLSKRRLFPHFGAIAALAGIVAGLFGVRYLDHDLAQSVDALGASCGFCRCSDQSVAAHRKSTRPA